MAELAAVLSGGWMDTPEHEYMRLRSKDARVESIAWTQYVLEDRMGSGSTISISLRNFFLRLFFSHLL